MSDGIRHVARRVAVVVPLGLALSGCGHKTEPEAPVPEISNPPAPQPIPEVAPEPLIPPPTNPPELPRLPTWDEVPSHHPAGATNPPAPALRVTPDGRCYKQWISPFLPPKYRGGQVVECPNPDPVLGDCGAEIVCTDEAAPLLAAWKAEHPG